MKRVPKRLVVLLVLLVVSFSFPSSAFANSNLSEYFRLPACSPRAEGQELESCESLGRMEYRNRKRPTGFSRPFSGQPADPSFAAVPFLYAQVTTPNAPIFASLDAAIQGEPVLRRIEAGFDFVTYIDAAEVDGKRYYMIDPGIWMRGKDLSRLGATGSFQGLVFSRTPKVPFGWVRNEVRAKRTPGYLPENYSGKTYYRYEVVKIYEVRRVADMDWYLVGPEEWVEGRQVGRVLPNPTPPQGVNNGRWIEVNLAEQTVAVYEASRLVFATMVATGREGAWTQPGLFQIYKKAEAETMQGSFTADRSDYYYLEDVPWTMYFDQARALHGTFWHNRFGWPQSRGCVNLSPGDANWLYQWAEEGDWVYVWDPSGQTPTDPALYNAGGA
jgi:lipoprotein-anchoring transpeptidase ErfK/SrfK